MTPSCKLRKPLSPCINDLNTSSGSSATNYSPSQPRHLSTSARMKPSPPPQKLYLPFSSPSFSRLRGSPRQQQGSPFNRSHGAPPTLYRCTFYVLLMASSACITINLVASILWSPNWPATDSHNSPRLTHGLGLRRQANKKRTRGLPRVVWMEKQSLERPRRGLFQFDPMLELEEPHPNGYGDLEHHDPNCVPFADWQVRSYPNCNSMHELGMASALGQPEKASNHARATWSNPNNLSFIAEGWFRTTWKLQDAQNTTVLKTLRLEREFLPEYYELHRRDAVALDRLTHSDFVVDIYGYCGQSTVNEYANFPIEGITSLETFDRRIRGQNSPMALMIKLRMAASIAMGLAHIHQAGHSRSELGDQHEAVMVHYDLNPRNIALFAGGRPKLNDFNIAEFLYVHKDTNETCGFPSRMHMPWWRSPEEVETDMLNTSVVGAGENVSIPQKPSLSPRILSAKVDIYALGNVMFHLLSSHAPRGQMHQDRVEDVRRQVLSGKPPVLKSNLANSTDPMVVVFRKAMDRCFAYEPAERASAQEIATMLTQALMKALNVHVHDRKVSSPQALVPDKLPPDESGSDEGDADETDDGHG